MAKKTTYKGSYSPHNYLESGNPMNCGGKMKKKAIGGWLDDPKQKFQSIPIDESLSKGIDLSAINSTALLAKDTGVIDKLKTNYTKNKILNDTSKVIDNSDAILKKKDKFDFLNKSEGIQIAASGGILEEYNGDTHANGGITLGQDKPFVEVEDEETAINDGDSKYVFPDKGFKDNNGKTIFVPGTKKTFAQVSKQYNNKLKLRPWDNITKDYVQGQLSNLKDIHEDIQNQLKVDALQKFEKKNPGVIEEVANQLAEQKLQQSSQSVENQGEIPMKPMGGEVSNTNTVNDVKTTTAKNTRYFNQSFTDPFSGEQFYPVQGSIDALKRKDVVPFDKTPDGKILYATKIKPGSAGALKDSDYIKTAYTDVKEGEGKSNFAFPNDNLRKLYFKEGNPYSNRLSLADDSLVEKKAGGGRPSNYGTNRFIKTAYDSDYTYKRSALPGAPVRKVKKSDEQLLERDIMNYTPEELTLSDADKVTANQITAPTALSAEQTNYTPYTAQTIDTSILDNAPKYAGDIDYKGVQAKKYVKGDNTESIKAYEDFRNRNTQLAMRSGSGNPITNALVADAMATKGKAGAIEDFANQEADRRNAYNQYATGVEQFNASNKMNVQGQNLNRKSAYDEARFGQKLDITGRNVDILNQANQYNTGLRTQTDINNAQMRANTGQFNTKMATDVEAQNAGYKNAADMYNAQTSLGVKQFNIGQKEAADSMKFGYRNEAINRKYQQDQYNKQMNQAKRQANTQTALSVIGTGATIGIAI